MTSVYLSDSLLLRLAFKYETRKAVHAVIDQIIDTHLQFAKLWMQSFIAFGTRVKLALVILQYHHYISDCVLMVQKVLFMKVSGAEIGTCQWIQDFQLLIQTAQQTVVLGKFFFPR